MVPDDGFSVTVIHQSYHLQGVVFKTVKIYVTMSKLSKEKKQVIDEEKPIINQRSFRIGFIDEDFIDEYLEEENEKQTSDEEE
jgi:hypothetical protein